MMKKILREYKKPVLKKHGNIKEITEAAWQGENFDDIRPTSEE